MNIEINLGTIRPWSDHGGVHVTGTAYLDGEKLEGASLASVFEEPEKRSAFGDVADSLSGHFAVARERDDEVWAAIDHVGTIPVFYGADDESGYVSDDGEWVRERLGADTVSRFAATEYLLFRFVSGTRTLYRGVHQSQPGQVIVGAESDDEVTFTTHQYYNHELVDPPITDRSELLDELDDLLVDAFERFVDFADGRIIAVSLSGGYDSRLITSMLERLEYENVVTFSCLKGSREDVDRAQTVADKVDLPWQYAQLSHEDWREFYESVDWDAFMRDGYALSGKPFVFDLPPIKALKESGAIPDDAVFVCGHTAVDPARPMNRHLRKERRYTGREFADAVIDFHHCQWDYEGSGIKRRLQEGILNEVDSESFQSRRDAVESYERWRWTERESKYIVSHHLRVYDYVDHDWWLPLYDRDLLDFWCRTPIDDKAGRDLYQRYVEDLYANVTGVPKRDAQVTTGSSQLVSQLEATLSGTRLKPIASDIYHRYEQLRESMFEDDRAEYVELLEKEPRYGVMGGLLVELPLEYIESFEGLHTAAILGLISFDAPQETSIPTDGVLIWDKKPLTDFPVRNRE